MSNPIRQLIRERRARKIAAERLATEPPLPFVYKPLTFAEYVERDLERFLADR